MFETIAFIIGFALGFRWLIVEKRLKDTKKKLEDQDAKNTEYTNYLVLEITKQSQALYYADNIRKAQRQYMANRGNEVYGRKVAEACQIYDDHRDGMKKKPEKSPSIAPYRRSRFWSNQETCEPVTIHENTKIVVNLDDSRAYFTQSVGQEALNEAVTEWRKYNDPSKPWNFNIALLNKQGEPAYLGVIRSNPVE